MGNFAGKSILFSAGQEAGRASLGRAAKSHPWVLLLQFRCSLLRAFPPSPASVWKWRALRRHPIKYPTMTVIINGNFRTFLYEDSRVIMAASDPAPMALASNSRYVPEGSV